MRPLRRGPSTRSGWSRGDKLALIGIVLTVPAAWLAVVNNAVQYPGGAVQVTSNATAGSGVAWAIAYVTVATPCDSAHPGNCAGTVYAYSADDLTKLWCTNSLSGYPSYCDNSTNFTPATFARPTIVNGNVYVPTYGGITKAGNPRCSTSNQCNGVIVYLHNP